MRGLMFNYLLECVEYHYGYETVDTIIESSGMQNQGSFANGGMYEDADFIKLVKTTSKILKTPDSELLELCGKQIFPHLYQRLLTIYDQHSHRTKLSSNAFDFISMLEHIHYNEVVKLYPDSIFPHFDVLNRDHSKLEIVYRSSRNFPFLAKGLLEGCIEYFNEPLSIKMQDTSENDSTIFIIQREQA